MKIVWNRSGFTGFLWLVAVYCLIECPLFGQCGETKAPPATSASCCSGTATKEATRPTVSMVHPGTIMAGDGTELSDYWTSLGPDAALWYQHVQTLASPAFEGREPGTRGIERAADYIEFYFREYGLAVPFAIEKSGPSYRQTVSFEIAPGAETASVGSLSWGGDDLVAGKDFVMTSIAGEGVATGPIAFVGYGLNEGPEGYSSFDATTNLSGRIALVLRLEPLREDGGFRWGSGPEHSSMVAKFSAIAVRGAAGILIVNPPGAKHELPELDTLASAGSCCSGSPRLPTAMITADAADRLLRRADPQSRNLLAWRRLADEGKVKTVNLREDSTVTLTARVKPIVVKTDNVGGALPGKGKLKDQWLVIGGHYDHIGKAPSARVDSTDRGVLLGADDNASGTALVLQLAQRLSKVYAEAPSDANLRSIMFVAFTGEERGLLGSRHFVQYAPMSLGSIHAMLNFDAVGRMRDNKLWLYGYGTAREFGDLVGPLLTESGLDVVTEPGSHSSDQVSFQEVDIPVLFANTGGHTEYHTSRDLAPTVNPRGAAKVLDLSEKIARRLADSPGRLTYQDQPTTGTSCCSSAQPTAGDKSAPSAGCCGSSNKSESQAKPKCCG